MKDLVISHPNKNNIYIDLEDLERGIYFLHLQFKNKEEFIKLLLN